MHSTKETHSDSAWFYDCSDVIRLKKSCKSTVPIPNFRRNWWTLVLHSAAQKQQLHMDLICFLFSQIPQHLFVMSCWPFMTHPLPPLLILKCTLTPHFPHSLLLYLPTQASWWDHYPYESLNTQNCHSLQLLLPKYLPRMTWDKRHLSCQAFFKYHIILLMIFSSSELNASGNFTPFLHFFHGNICLCCSSQVL